MIGRRIMEVLFSNYPPMKTNAQTFTDAFYDLIPQASELDIAVGYVSSDSLIELQKIVEFNKNINRLNLIIGMHYFDRFTKVQYDTAIHLNDFLHTHNRGEVRLVNAFRYHGKLYSYKNDIGPFAGIVGSNNLNSIVDGGVRAYESAVLINEPDAVRQISDFISLLSETSSKNISEFKINVFNTQNTLLEGHDLVKQISVSELTTIINAKTEISFEIPIKTFEDSPRSNLNVFFGKGRESPNGLVKPRHWYEVELIVPKKVTSQPGYPQSQSKDSEFTVFTDDGWSFKCKVSGDYSKNFRSDGDLKILGRWLKGRLENAGALEVGQPVTAETLLRYGRNTFTLTKTSKNGIWFLDFGVKK